MVLKHIQNQSSQGYTRPVHWQKNIPFDFCIIQNLVRLGRWFLHGYNQWFRPHRAVHLFERICISLGVENSINSWWCAAMALETLPTILLTDAWEISNKSPVTLWKLPQAKNRKLVSSCNIGGMLASRPENTAISKIEVAVSLENLNLCSNLWSSRSSIGLDMSRR